MSSVFEGKNISSTIVKLGVPAMLGQLATLIYNLADTYFVSLTKSADQIAAVTLCVPVLLIIMSVACVFGMGGSSVIARQLGEGKKEDSAKCLNFCLYSIALSGVLVLAAGLLVLKPAAYVIGADEGNLGYTCDYLKWIFVGAPFIMLSNGLTHSLRAVGLIKESTVGIAVGNGVNIVLDWLFIVIFHMGTAGAALATSIGFLCATVYYIGCLAREERSGNELVTLSPGSFRPTKGMARNVVVIGIPGALITVMMSVSNIVLNNYIGIYGSDAVASYGIAYKIDMFPIMLSVGLSQGGCTAAGILLWGGAGKTSGAGYEEQYGLRNDSRRNVYGSFYGFFPGLCIYIFVREGAYFTDGRFSAAAVLPCTAAWDYQYGDLLFSGSGQGGKFSGNYRAA